MAAPAPLPASDADLVEQYCQAVTAAGLRMWRSSRQAAQTFCRRLDRAGGWAAMRPDQQLAAAKTQHAAPFVAWLVVTGRLGVDAGFLVAAGMRLGSAAARYQPAARLRFAQATARLGATAADTALQWHMLAMLTAATGTTVDHIDTERFLAGRKLLLDAYHRRARPDAGRNPAAVLHRLQTTLFHDQAIDSITRPGRVPVRESGWVGIAGAYRQAAHRYVAQVSLSLRPSTVTAIERDLRFFGRWLATYHPDVIRLVQLRRAHLEAYKTHLATAPSRTGAPLDRVSVKNILINLRCFFTRITEWGYPDTPARPLLFDADLPIIDKPLPRFLDDAAATKLLRTARADPDPFARLVVELLARTGMRKGELLALTIDAVVQIGSAFWLRIPVGKLHNDRYIPLHPELKALLDDQVARRPQACARTCCLCTAAGRSPPAASTGRSPRSPRRPGSGTSPRISCATPWPPRRSTAA